MDVSRSHDIGKLFIRLSQAQLFIASLQGSVHARDASGKSTADLITAEEEKSTRKHTTHLEKDSPLLPSTQRHARPSGVFTLNLRTQPHRM